MLTRLQGASLLLLLFMVPAAAPAQDANPVADARAIVTDGSCRFTILTPRLLRLEWAADGVFEDHASLVFLNRQMTVPPFTVSVSKDTLLIRTSALELRFLKGSGRLAADNLEIRFSLNGVPHSWRPGTADLGNLKGTIRTLDGVEGATPLEPGLVSRDGWAVVDDGARPLFDASPWAWVMPRPSGERQDLYFFGYGHDFRAALHDFTAIAGRIPMPPRFAFGTWWSRYWSYTDQEFKDLVRQFEEHTVPLDVLVIDMDWHLTFDMRWSKNVVDQAGQMLGWTGYTWDPNVFPDPVGFLAWCKNRGLKTTLNIHPASGIQPHEAVYPEMARAMGTDPSTKHYVPFDITDKKFTLNYMNLVMHPLQRQGIDFFWLDWQQWGSTAIPGVTPTWWLNYVFFTDMEREGKARPLLFHRWGGLGNHRYQIGFSGDVVSVWPSLAFQPYFTATAANVGFGYWSHDIGGHMPGVLSPELYTRWIQFGVFSPILRTHTTKNPGAERRIWAYPVDDFARMRDAFLLRYALIPYLYTSARMTYDSGLSICHPLYYDYPETGEAYARTDEYLFGDAMLVAPVVSPVSPDSMLAARTLWLPPGNWFEWQTGTLLAGPMTLTRCYALDEIPVFLRPGAIIPMQPAMKYTGEKTVDPLILTIAPGDSGSTRVYEDAGNTTAYQRGEGAWTPVRFWKTENLSLKIVIGPVEGQYPGLPVSRSFEVVLPGAAPPLRVTGNGAVLSWTRDKASTGWSYDGDHASVRIRTGAYPVGSKVEVVLSMPSGVDSLENELNGLPGRLARLQRVMTLLNNQWPKEWSPGVLVKAAQTGNRLTINPVTFRDELGRFSRSQEEIRGAIRGMAVPDSIKTRALKHLTAGY